MKRGPRPDDAARGKQAARWLADQTGNVTYAAAGKRFGITREAVRLAWQQLGLGETPRSAYWRHTHAAILTLAQGGKSVRQIAELTGAPGVTVYQRCRRAGVALKDTRGADPAFVAAGLEIVRAGGSVGEGACAAGIQYASFQRHLKKANITPVPFDQRKRRLNRSAQAALLVEHEGASVGDAAQILGISPNSVREYMRRRIP